MTQRPHKSELGDVLRSLGGVEAMREIFAALNAYLEKVTQCMARQIREAGGKTPAQFIIPPPADALQEQEVIKFIERYLQECCNYRFPSEITVLIDNRSAQ
jgi:hypothetical protein